jgi:outer membrane immunogenic protein
VPGTAADLPAASEPVTPVYLPFSWTGFFVGAQVGYAWGDSKMDFPTGFLPGFVPLDRDGVFGGAYAGYNYQFNGGFVAGVDADINFGDVSGSGVYTFNNGLGSFPFQRADSQLDGFGSARLRLGYGIDRFLPYVAGGIAFGDYDIDGPSPASL